jgi:uncharacterized protein
MDISRRGALAALVFTGTSLARPSLAKTATLDLFTAGKGSAFLPYGEGLARIVNAGDAVRIVVRESKGSIENIGLVESSAGAVATVFLGSAFEALNGIGPFKDRRHVNLRAIAPMYETSFQIAARTETGLTTVSALAGRRVGVGPAGGPAEAFFKGLIELAGISCTIVNGTSAELETSWLAGSIDALWQGASVPIPALRRLADQVETTVFGLTDAEVAAMLRRFPYLASGDVAPGAYRGQRTPLRTVAAWNVIVAHRDLAEPVAYALTRAILGSPDIVAATNGAGAGTRAENAVKNGVIAYHPGAARYLRERGIAVFEGR